MQSSDLNTKISQISEKQIVKHPSQSTQKFYNSLYSVKKSSENLDNSDNLDKKSCQKVLGDFDDKHRNSELDIKISNQQKQSLNNSIHSQADNNLDFKQEYYREEKSAEAKNTIKEEKSLSTDDTSGSFIKPRGFLPVLQNGNFLALWSGQVFSQIADKVYLVLMIAIINASFQDSTTTISGWVSALMMAFTIPAILFGSLAGVFVDRWSKKRVLVATNFWRGILVLIIPSLLWLSDGMEPVGGILPVGFLIILGITFLVSTLTQFFAPAEQAVIPLIVEEEDLLSANSLYTTTMMASVIVGFAVGEPLLAAVDSLWSQFIGGNPYGKELLVGGSYLLAGMILLLLVTKENRQEKLENTKGTLQEHPPSAIADLQEGFAYLRKNQRLRNALIQLVILFSVIAALTVSAIRLAEVIPTLKAEQFGFLLAAGGIGIAIGAAILGQFGQRFSYTQLSLWGCFGIIASLSALSLFTTQLWIVLFLIAAIGIFGSFIGIPMQTTIQTETPANMRGKVFGLQNNIVNIALSLPLALAGIAETFVGLNTVFLGLAAFVLLGILLSRNNCYE
ncbi:MAG: MFS transporter [Cyanobacteria bacterium P01_A01_bin.45]